MKKITSPRLLVILIVLTSISTFAQSAKNQEIISKALKNETIKNQFEILTSKSGDFQDYKNLKHFNLNKFKSNFSDSLLAIDNKFKTAYAKIDSQKVEIENLKSQISSINENLDTVTLEKDSINILGFKMTKSTYNVSLWSLIGTLLATTLLLLFKFKTSNKATKIARNSYAEVETDFETHKKGSLEREQVLRRKLQDEINKQRGV
ncbi:MAG: tRNA (guanine-N1)-methyltransferase [Flavobacteriaceae bacterium]